MCGGARGARPQPAAGATSEKITEVEQRIDALIASEIKKRSAYGARRVNLLALKPGDVFAYHGWCTGLK